MGDSNLICYTCISPNKTLMTNKINRKITIHHMAGNLSIEKCGKIFSNKNRKASSNYGIGSDGRIGLYVNEKDRAWTSSNSTNDSQAVTIEVANNTLAPEWGVSDQAMASLIDLCTDICIRNNIGKLVFTGNAEGNLTQHNYFANTECPGKYLKGKFGYIADAVNKKLGVISQIQVPTKINNNMSVVDIYMFFKNKGMTDAGVSGLLGNLMAESGIRSNNLQNSYERLLGLSDDAYVRCVDNKTHDFVYDKAGFGIAQWTYFSRKQNLLNYADAIGHSIGSMQMQVEFLYNELCTSYKGVLHVLNTTNDVKMASDTVLLHFEKPADQSDKVKNARYKCSLDIYTKYANGKKTELTCPFLIKCTRNDLNIRKGAGTNYDKNGKLPMGTFTVTEVKSGTGSTLGWGKLKSGVGWVSLDYVTIK